MEETSILTNLTMDMMDSPPSLYQFDSIDLQDHEILNLDSGNSTNTELKFIQLIDNINNNSISNIDIPNKNVDSDISLNEVNGYEKSIHSLNRIEFDFILSSGIFLNKTKDCYTATRGNLSGNTIIEDESKNRRTNYLSLKESEYHPYNKKQSNKEAALRYRQKKTKEKEELFQSRMTLEKENKELKTKIEEVQNEISCVKDILVDMLFKKNVFNSV